MVDSPTFGNNYTVQFCDSTGAVLKTFSSANGMIDDRVGDIERKYYTTGGVMSITDLTTEFRVKVISGGVQQCCTVRFNFLWLIKNNYFNMGDSTTARYVYSLYETTLPNYVLPTAQ
jgi:hypothetical protein